MPAGKAGSAPAGPLVDAAPGRGPGLLLAGATALLAGFHALFGLARTGPAVVADEAGYLFAVRALADHGSGPLAGTAYYRGGWSLLLVPVELATSSPMAVFRAGLLLNALLAALVVPLLYLVLHRYARVPARAALVGAVVGGLYPALHVLSQAALPESLLAVLVLVVACCFGELALGRRRLVWAVALGAGLAYAYSVHGRAVALIAVSLILLGCLAGRRVVSVAQGAAVVGTLALGIWLSLALDRHLVEAVYGGTAADGVSSTVRSVLDGTAVSGTARNLVGQAWYVAVASLGLVPFLLARLGDPGFRQRFTGPGVALVAPVLTLLGLLGVSALFLSSPTRPDHLIYGRYVESALPPLVALATVELLRRAPTRKETGVAAALVLALTGAVALLRSGLQPVAGPNRWNISALPAAPTADLGPVVLLMAGGVAVVLLVLLRRLPPALLVLAFLGVAAYGQLVPVRSADDIVYGAGWRSPAELVPADADVGVLPTTTDAAGRYAYPWFVRGSVTVTDDAEYVFADSSSPGRAGWTRVWTDPRGRVVLYRTSP